ncbi:rab-GTPase-TBC domain-containing protein [Pilobolus umbonatus]|nr:rab-GTPase-TBC domain-containing protein [Pilobolus umbonatus]
MNTSTPYTPHTPHTPHIPSLVSSTPLLYQSNPPQKVHLIYTKSGFYLKYNTPEETSIHGFFAILSQSMDHAEIIVAWIPEYLIDPSDIPQFITLDGQLPTTDSFPLVQFNLGENETTTIALKNIDSLYLCPPSLFTLGSIIITSCSGDVFKPIWYSTHEHNRDYKLDKESWPGFNIVDILNAFIPITRYFPRQYTFLLLSFSDCKKYRSDEMQHVYLVKPKPKDPLVDRIQDARWALLDRLSKITQISRDTATQAHRLTRSLIPNSLHTLRQEYSTFTTYMNEWAHSPTPTPLASTLPDVETPLHTRRHPVSAEEWTTFFDLTGHIQVPVSTIRSLVFRGGLDPDIRIEAWKFLLGIYPWDSTSDEREAIRQSRTDAYFAIKAKWFDDTDTRNSRWFLDEKHRIDKDVHRTDRTQDAFKEDDLPNPDTSVTDRTNANLEVMKDVLVSYNYYKTELGYVQGMSDLLAPLLIAMEDEAMAFWGFSGFMDIVQSNFFMDQSGMHGQLKTLGLLVQLMDPDLYKRLEVLESSNFIFCFRWLLIWFKREFVWEDVVRLWEVLWTQHLSSKMVLFVAMAIIDQHRTPIMEEINAFDELLKYMNEQSEKIPLELTLQRSEVLFYQFERKVRAMQQKQSILEERLKLRFVWNSEERPLIQDDLERLKIDPVLLELLNEESS